MSRLFVGRPILAAVISILIVLFGAIAYRGLPRGQYPDMTPPVIRVSANYPGASPRTIADALAYPIEQQVNGVEGMLYMSSRSSGTGQYTLDITFKLGTSADEAQTLVQNRVAVAEPMLPEDVRRLGVIVRKQSSSMVNIISVDSSDAEHSLLFLSNYAMNTLRERLLRLEGVGDVAVFPQMDYSMRVWLQPPALARFDVTVPDVLAAIRSQNVSVAAGLLGDEPSTGQSAFAVRVTTRGQLSQVDEFQRIVVARRDGRLVTVGDVARVEIDAQRYGNLSLRNGKEAAVLVVYQTPDGNAVTIAEHVRRILEEEGKRAPAGLRVNNDYDASLFVEASLEEVLHTLLEAFVLVVLVVLIFLGNWRSTIIPIVTIPVALIGTFAAMSLFGFSLNSVTMFGLVLAIGIVVDDAIVVVENVERVMAERHLPPREATIEAMGEITGPIISISLVLMAVFLPPAMLGGISGALFRQFALTIAVSTAFSAINALTLSPALCALLLKAHAPGHEPRGFNRWFNNLFGRLSNRYGDAVGAIGRKLTRWALVFVGLLVVTGVAFSTTPGGFVPAEDQGLLIVDVRLPAGAARHRTDAAMRNIREQVEAIPGVHAFIVVSGFSTLAGPATNHGVGFVVLDSWGARAEKAQPISGIKQRINGILVNERSATMAAFELPPVPGLGTGSGFELRLLDESGLGSDAQYAVTMDLARIGKAQDGIASLMTSFTPAAPELSLAINRDLTERLQVPLNEVFTTLGATLGSAYVNDFTHLGRTYQVRVSADAQYRDDIDSILQLEVRSRTGALVPLAAVLTPEDAVSPTFIERYNMRPSTALIGSADPGVSSGTAIALMSAVLRDQLPPGMSFEWTGLAYQEQLVAGQMVVVFGLALLVVLLILAALYESVAYPFVVVLTVPCALLGALAGIGARGIPNDLFVQAGLVLLVGLAAKNAILIVEVAKVSFEQHGDALRAAVDACKQRLRPILMTSFAFIFGVVPLAIGTGAGAVSRQELGTTVLSGMLGATVLGLFVTPLLFMLIAKLLRRAPSPEVVEAPVEPPPAAPP